MISEMIGALPIHYRLRSRFDVCHIMTSTPVKLTFPQAQDISASSNPVSSFQEISNIGLGSPVLSLLATFSQLPICQQFCFNHVVPLHRQCYCASTALPIFLDRSFTTLQLRWHSTCGNCFPDFFPCVPSTCWGQKIPTRRCKTLTPRRRAKDISFPSKQVSKTKDVKDKCIVLLMMWIWRRLCGKSL
jgi:hypothetical protein